jgi:nitrogen fixation/metabolism regulation signal transduction histidine kinase
VSLQIKLVAALVVIVLLPLAVSAYLIDGVGRVAANFAANEAQARQAPMERAVEIYRELFQTQKNLRTEIARRIATRPEIVAPTSGGLDVLLSQEAGVHAIAVLDPAGATLADAERPLPGPRWHLLDVDHPLPDGGTLRLGFAAASASDDDQQRYGVTSQLQADMQRLNETLTQAKQLQAMHTALPAGYRWAFLAMLGGAALIAALLGVLAARRVTVRIAALVGAARSVSAGHMDARVELGGSDEMAELGDAFNAMLDNLDTTRRQIEYLQRIGAWQDVARRLAHEIKNPLTPIQLAVQQCVSSYGSVEPERYRKLLAETGEIVEEEIAGLRRLVDTFRTLGQLPKVEPVPLALGDVIEDLRLDPAFASRVSLVPPAGPVQVRGDKLLLKRVLANLVENGIHAGEDNAQSSPDVVITWSAASDGKVRITVDDHGRGVTADARDRIFEPYVTTKPTGTGLGLAIAKKIALEHGGDLAVAPDPAPTGGARFVLTLPAA